MTKSTTIVIDLDETLCFHRNRDYANALPNLPVINKVQELHAAGVEIIVHTARGMHSCNGYLGEIERKNRQVTEEWLRRNNVPFDELKFGKPLAMLYVDDKAMTPEVFAAMNTEQFSGRSGGTVQRLGTQVYKSCSNAKEQWEWFKKAEANCFETPRLYSLSPDGYLMDFVDGSQHVADLVSANPIGLLQSFKNINTEKYHFSTYLEYCTSKIDSGLKARVLKRFQGYDFTEHSSFCHGDLTLSNLVLQNGNLVLLDPSFKTGMWQSYLIDVGRLAQSAILHWETRYLANREMTDAEEYFYKKLEADLYSTYTIDVVSLMLLLICTRVLPFLSGTEEQRMKSSIEELLC